MNKPKSDNREEDYDDEMFVFFLSNLSRYYGQINGVIKSRGDEEGVIERANAEEVSFVSISLIMFGFGENRLFYVLQMLYADECTLDVWYVC